MVTASTKKNSLKLIRQNGIDVVVFEQRSNSGGMWFYESAENSSSQCYESLSTNTPKRLTGNHLIFSTNIPAYSDYPMPDTFPTFPSHSQILSYLRTYADHFHLNQKILFRHKVIQVTEIQGISCRVCF